ncbi:MAG: hypothetical protein EON52_10330 [Actinomycetales bacterium]|nr:MAG: hypothetical protein EON52_10330 [Actinomycetales bacterium]
MDEEVRSVVDVQALPDSGLDAICLDVDNGPDFLVHPANHALYRAESIARCAEALRPGGILAVWSMADSPELRRALAGHLDDVDGTTVPVRLQGRDETYWILSGRRRNS